MFLPTKCSCCSLCNVDDVLEFGYFGLECVSASIMSRISASALSLHCLLCCYNYWDCCVCVFALGCVCCTVFKLWFALLLYCYCILSYIVVTYSCYVVVLALWLHVMVALSCCTVVPGRWLDGYTRQTNSIWLCRKWNIYDQLHLTGSLPLY